MWFACKVTVSMNYSRNSSKKRQAGLTCPFHGFCAAGRGRAGSAVSPEPDSGLVPAEGCQAETAPFPGRPREGAPRGLRLNDARKADGNLI